MSGTYENAMKFKGIKESVFEQSRTVNRYTPKVMKFEAKFEATFEAKCTKAKFEAKFDKI